MSCSHIKTEVKTEEEELRSKTGGFLCPACGEQLFYEKYFIEHIRERHYKPDLQVQDEENSLLHEFARGSVTEQDGCCVENKCDVLKSEVKTEQSEFNGEAGGFHCSDCGETFLEEDSFIKHINDHVSTSGKRKRQKGDQLQNDSYNSSQGSEINKRLDSSTVSQESLNSQENILASKKHFKCPDCLYVTARKSTLRDHLTTHTGVKLHKCPDCSYAAAQKSQLKVHLMTHSGEKPFKCPDCSYAAAHKSNLSVHMKTHSGEKPFKCSDCLFATARKSNLRVHIMNIHSGEKPFQCSDCFYKAAQKSNLIIHMKTHSGEKPFKCPDCSYATVLKSNLRGHIINIHSGEKPFKCPDCSYAAAQKSDLKRHMSTHSGEKLFKCPDCLYAAGQKSHLLRHQKIHARKV